ncbi:MAG: type I-D CRISPR-associated protein Cas7/Csc2 [Acidobacteriaceae bacterium]|nr:type I-D CRISPR-associated protein Cas7/Csc2 [Acidobacteriaceae bacterium]MBV9779429.1 type I-D CRISPR-associated protein Cas7/Csc2 [Acidobacteriaceae bacterium]
MNTINDYLVVKPRPLLSAEAIQLLLLREVLDYTVLRTEDSREINSVDTPLSIKDSKTVKRVAFLGSKQKAAESRELESLLRSACSAANFDAKECWLKDNLCLECPRCALFGATALSEAPNIRHRIEYSTAFSLLTFDLLTEEITFNAVDEKTQTTGQALGVRHVVRPASLFASIVTLRSVTRSELILAVKTLLSSKSYGGETRIGGDCRNTVIGIVAGWEEIITPLELTLELYERRTNIDRAIIASFLEREYKPKAGTPAKVKVLSDSEIESVISECANTNIDNAFLADAYKAVKEYRGQQGG